MKIKNNFKYLPILFLIPTIVVVFSISVKPDTPLIGSVIAQLSESNQGLIDQSTKGKLLEDIKKLRQFNEAIQAEEQCGDVVKRECLIAELDRAITKKNATKPDVFKSAKETLEPLQKSFADVENSKLESLQETFPEVQQGDLESIKASSKSIADTLAKMIEVITPLADEAITPGKPSEKLKEVQDKLGATPADGDLGNGTKDKISAFLDQQNDTLVTELGTLEPKVNSLQEKEETNITPPHNPKEPSNPNETKDIKQLESQIKKLEKDNNFFKKLIFVIALLSITNLFALLRIIWVLDKRKQENDQQFENIYRNLDHKISNRVNNLKEQISDLEISTQISEIPRRNIRNRSILNRSGRYSDEASHDSGYDDDYSRYADAKIDSIHNQETTRRLSDHQEEESVTQVDTFPETSLVQSYNDNRKLLAQNGTKVAITKSSLEQDRLGSNQAAILNENYKGDYFVIRENGFEYLFPGEKLKVNQHNLATVEKLFVCTGYESSPSGKFKLIKAAVVSRSSRSELVLQQPGELRFL